MSTTFRLDELANVRTGRYRLDTAPDSTSPADDLSLSQPDLWLQQHQQPEPIRSSTGRTVLYAKRLGFRDVVSETIVLAADSQARGAPSGAAGATLQALADLDATKAPLASPAFTGTPTAPTAAAGTNTTQVATTAFTRGEVAALVASAPGTLDTLGEIAAALASDESAATALATTVASKAPLASPVFTGNPTAPTPTAGDNDTSIATTAFVKTAVGSSVASPPVVPALFVLWHTGDNNTPRFAFDGSEADNNGAETKTIFSAVVNVAPGGSFGLQRWMTATPGVDATLGYCEVIVQSRSGTDRIIANPATGLVPSPSGEPLNPIDLPFTGSWDLVGSDLTIVDGRVQTAAGGDFFVTVSMTVTVSPPT